MNLLRYLAIIPLIVIIFTSCSDERNIIKHLTGTWGITEFSQGGTAVAPTEYENMAFNFDDCKLKDEECGGSITDGAGGVTQMLWKLGNNGESIDMTMTPSDPPNKIFPGDKYSFILDEFSDEEMTLSFTDTAGVVNTVVLQH